MAQATDEALAALLAGARAADLEGDRLDFKEAAPDTKATLKLVADAAVCFANALGGDIVLGVNDKAAGPVALVSPNSPTTSCYRLFGWFGRTVGSRTQRCCCSVTRRRSQNASPPTDTRTSFDPRVGRRPPRDCESADRCLPQSSR